MLANELLMIAIDEVRNLKHEEEFMLKDLFLGYKWNRIDRSTRILLGTLFLNHVKSHDIGVIPLEKAASGQQRYIRQ